MSTSMFMPLLKVHISMDRANIQGWITLQRNFFHRLGEMFQPRGTLGSWSKEPGFGKLHGEHFSEQLS